jgi:hypothetical protein
MKFALINGDKTEATKGAKGFCPGCGAELIARCGEDRVDHWAHKGRRNCDPWWENEKEWHRSWKNNFPREWQEVTQTDEVSGEKHIADVKTQTGYVLEFQHSSLNPEERRSRNAFYSKLVWIVDGTRRKTDRPQFEKVINESTVVIEKPLIRRVLFPEECRLLREWRDGNALVLFDFQDTKETNQSMLWFLFPEIVTNEAYISPFSRQNFIELHNENKFDELVRNIILPIRQELANSIQIRRENIRYGHPGGVPRFERYRANQRRRRRRF